MKYRFRAAKSFWRNWSKLSPDHQQASRHVEGQTVWSVSIGTHDIYKG
jgi:hypothetical protein